MVTPRYSRYTYYLIAAFVIFIALLWTAAAVQAQEETAVPTIEADVTAEQTPEPAAEPTAEPTPDTPAPSPEQVTSAGIGFGAALIIAFLTGGVSFGGIVLWAKSDPTRLKQLELIGDSLPAHVGTRLIELGNTAITVMSKVTEGLQLFIEAIDRVPANTKTVAERAAEQTFDDAARAFRTSVKESFDVLRSEELTPPDKPVGPVG
jgi:hypothetical protein